MVVAQGFVVYLPQPNVILRGTARFRQRPQSRSANERSNKQANREKAA